MMPSSIMSTYWPVCALKPLFFSFDERTVLTTTAPSSPAFCAIWMQGWDNAALIASTPTCWSRLSSFNVSSFCAAKSNAVPPPGTMPSSKAAFVAQSASFKRSFTSLTSTSLAPPTLMTATPPESFASRSFNLSFSYSDVVLSMASRMVSQRASMLVLSPAPSRITVSSLVMVTVLAVPSCVICTSSSLSPNSSEIISQPVNTAKSLSISLRLSPKPGAFTAATFKPPRSLLTMSNAKASPSMSSATMSNGFCTFATCSKIGRIGCTEEIFFSNNSTRGFSISTFCAFAFVMKYGEM
mmetsp:Transcript_16627/g.33746  ORF Transcript_16627/g.33746 Transcript_16627/m.33746 type:complete len:297 (-) Transcript_16627:781-1671(-)